MSSAVTQSFSTPEECTHPRCLKPFSVFCASCVVSFAGQRQTEISQTCPNGDQLQQGRRPDPIGVASLMRCRLRDLPKRRFRLAPPGWGFLQELGRCLGRRRVSDPSPMRRDSRTCWRWPRLDSLQSVWPCLACWILGIFCSTARVGVFPYVRKTLPGARSPSLNMCPVDRRLVSNHGLSSVRIAGRCAERCVVARVSVVSGMRALISSHAALTSSCHISHGWAAVLHCSLSREFRASV